YILDTTKSIEKMTYEYKDPRFPYNITRITRDGKLLASLAYSNDNKLIDYDYFQDNGELDYSSDGEFLSENKMIGERSVIYTAAFHPGKTVPTIQGAENILVHKDVESKTKSITEASGEDSNDISFEWYDDGRLASKTDENGIKQNYKYYDHGLIKQVTYQDTINVSEGLVTLDYKYEKINNKYLPQENTIYRNGEADYYIERMKYNTDGEIVAYYKGWVEDPNSSSDGFSLVQYEYHTTGSKLLYKVYKSISNHLGNPKGNKRKLIQEYQYNANGQVTKVTGGKTSYLNADQIGSEKSFLSYQYQENGNLHKTTDNRGIVNEVKYDSIGRIVFKKTYHQNNVNDLFKTTYFYDALGRLNKVSDSTGAEQTFTYDKYDNLIASFNKKGYGISNAINSSGQLIRTVDTLGALNSYSFDHDNRLVEKYDNGYLTKFVYLKNGQLSNIQKEFLRARLTKTEFGYDILGQNNSVINRLVDDKDANSDLLDSIMQTQHLAPNGNILDKENSIL
ncbi:hypothetical protein MJH12_02885, partial [bacterium]|nr:hypothetical protein [bacterium]